MDTLRDALVAREPDEVISVVHLVSASLIPSVCGRYQLPPAQERARSPLPPCSSRGDSSLARSVVFRDLRSLPEFIELGSDERVELPRVIPGQSVYADQLDDISQVLKSMGSRHSTGDFEFKQ